MGRKLDGLAVLLLAVLLMLAFGEISIWLRVVFLAVGVVGFGIVYVNDRK